jgi:hypothetical protein
MCEARSGGPDLECQGRPLTIVSNTRRWRVANQVAHGHQCPECGGTGICFSPVYETSARDRPTRIFYMQHCTAPADHTWVLVRKGPTFGRLQMADVRFATGEFCSAAIVFGTRSEEQGVVRTTSGERRKAPHAA